MGAVRSGEAARIRIPAAGAIVLVLALAAPVWAQQQGQRRTLSLADALRLAEDASESVAVARAGVLRSDGELKRARSEYFPQIFASASYTRTLDSEFSVFSSDSPADSSSSSSSDCGTFTPNPALPLGQRVDSLEAAVRCQSDANPFAAFSDLPFGRENQWRFDLSVSQTVFSGGRVGAQSRIARAGQRVAALDLASSRASLMLNVASAYYDAALADRLLQIAEATLTQSESTLDQVRLARQVGNQPEFELLRAQVTRDNQRPVVIRRRADRSLAHMRLRQILNLPADVELDLASGLDGDDITDIVRLATDVVGIVAMDTSADTRSAVLQATEAVRIQEAQVTIAKAQRLPSLSLSMAYGRVGYPEEVAPFDAAFRTNWTVGASIQLPLFTGGRLAGESLIARANLEEARARLDMTREAASLDTRDAFERLAAAEATWAASSGTVQQASQAYAIAEVRFTEGISTQLELNDSRILLQQAQANRAQAARDLQIARLRAALLPYLPLSGAGGGLQGQSVQVNQPFTAPAVPASATTQTTGTGAPAGAAGSAGGR